MPSSDEELVAQLATIELFAGLPREVLQSISAEMDRINVPVGASLFRQGDPSDALYLLTHGKMQASARQLDGSDEVLGVVETGELVGELALFTGGQRMATVTATNDCELVRFSAAALERLTGKHPEALRQIGNVILRRLRRNQLIAILPRIFGAVDLNAIRAIEAEAEWVQLPRGERLIEQGDPGGTLYILVSGRLYATVKGDDGSEKVVGEILAGESVGEMDILSDGVRSANVYASRDSELVKFTREGFDRLMARFPQAMRYLTGLVIGRLRRLIQPLSERAKLNTTIGVALVPVGSSGISHEFAERLTQALGRMGPALRLNRELFDTALGRSGAAQLPVDDPRRMRGSAWLNEQESRYAFIVYETDHEMSEWTRRCLRHADVILLIARSGDAPDRRGLEIEVERLVSANQRVGIRQHLVLIHDDGSCLPAGTQAWLTSRPVELHHHIRWNRPADFSRLARIVAGRAVGLALGGGGARGFAHIGTIRALREAGIPIDMVGGTSMGAVIAAEYALGWELEKMTAENRRIADGVFNDVTLPLVSILEGGNYSKGMRRLFGQHNIEDTWLPCYFASTNISSARVVVHRTGPVWKGVRASGNLPGLAPPINLNGDLLVDGALLDNLPMDVMRDWVGRGTVVAVDVSPPVDLADIDPYSDRLSGWWVLWHKLPFGRRHNVPNVAAIMQRVSELGSVYRLKDLIHNGVADLYLRPPVEKVDMFNFKLIDQIADLGYQFAKEKIAAWPNAPVWNDD